MPIGDDPDCSLGLHCTRSSRLSGKWSGPSILTVVSKTTRAARIVGADLAVTWTARVALALVTSNDCAAIHPTSIETLPDDASFSHITAMHAISEARPGAVSTLTDDGLAYR